LARIPHFQVDQRWTRRAKTSALPSHYVSTSRSTYDTRLSISSPSTSAIPATSTSCFTLQREIPGLPPLAERTGASSSLKHIHSFKNQPGRCLLRFKLTLKAQYLYITSPNTHTSDGINTPAPESDVRYLLDPFGAVIFHLTTYNIHITDQSATYLVIFSSHIYTSAALITNHFNGYSSLPISDPNALNHRNCHWPRLEMTDLLIKEHVWAARFENTGASSMPPKRMPHPLKPPNL